MHRQPADGSKPAAYGRGMAASMEQFHAANRRLIMRVGIIAAALFVSVGTGNEIKDLITRPHYPAGRAHLFQDMTAADGYLQARQVATLLTAKISAVYPRTVVLSNGEVGRSDTFMFTVHSAQKLRLDQIRAVLERNVYPLSCNSPSAVGRCDGQ